ncbi:hypothetical protein ACWGJ2_27340 [Streptomyces sp. NPDC054796]
MSVRARSRGRGRGRARPRTCATFARAVALTAVVATTAVVAPATGAAATGGHAPAWEVSEAGGLSANAHLSSVSAAGPHAAWAVGHQSFGGVSDGVILRWKDGSWRQDRTAGLPQVNYWHSVDAVSPRDVWAYGWSQTEEVATHYDGRRWQRVPLPDDAGPQQGFAELAAVPGRAWLAGDYSLSTWSHGVWQTEDLPTGISAEDVDARTADDAWAVGGFSYAGQESRPVALHWDGEDWTEVPVPGTGLRLAQVYAESARSVYATAYVSSVDGESHEPRVLHWNGRSWKDITGPVGGLIPQAVNGDGRGNVWVSGDPDGWEGPPVFWRYDGKRWSEIEGAKVTGGATQAYNITDLAPLGRTGRFWAVGSYELLVGESSSESYELIERSTR